MGSNKSILVTGACGYKGSVLVPKLLDKGYFVRSVDLEWFGNSLPLKNPMLEHHKVDTRDIHSDLLEGIDSIIHLASVANDPTSELDPKLSWEIGCLATMQLAEKAKKVGVKQFIYASSGSVYGVKSEEQVTENLELEPLSEYNKTKMCTEKIVESYKDDLSVHIIRPATVCGYSPRMRLDVAVNALTIQALKNKRITVFGGAQHRPNIHMQDITDLYIYFLNHPELTGIFNAGFENLTLKEIAEQVQSSIECEIVYENSNDPRSYRINSDKLLGTGFRPKFTVQHAIEEIASKYIQGSLTDKPEYYNLNWMKKNLNL